MTSSQDWEIPRRIWYILLSWGLGVIMITGLLSFWIWRNEHEQDRARIQLQVEQDRAMCAMLRVFLQAPEPPPGPQGERQREARTLMNDYLATLRCDELEVSPTRAPR